MTTSQDLDAPGCDTREMVMIHGLFRSIFRDAPTLVRRVATGDRERARIVGDHVVEIAGGLHHHHHSEDTLLWDELSARSPGCALHVDLMRRQHAAMAEALDRAEAAATAWQADPGESERETLALALDDVNAALGRHLGDEEQQILPTAGKVFTQREWNRLGELSRSQIPRNRLFIQLGFILSSMPPDDAKRFLEESLPAPARALYRLIGRRQYLAHRRRVYGELA